MLNCSNESIFCDSTLPDPIKAFRYSAPVMRFLFCDSSFPREDCLSFNGEDASSSWVGKRIDISTAGPDRLGFL